MKFDWIRGNVWEPHGPIRDVTDYIKLLTSFRRGYGGAGEGVDPFGPFGPTDAENGDRLAIWFRGHGGADWPLLPSLHRVPNERKLPLTEVEEYVSQQFQNVAMSLSGVEARDRADWLVSMRHHGAPTRLLDWSESALVGLYFAARDNWEQDGCVWVLTPVWLVELSTETDYESELPILPLLSDSILDAKVPMACRAGHRFARATAQSSCFTCHPNVGWQPLEDFVADRCDSDARPVFRIVVPARAKLLILDQLRLLGITERTVFPDLDGLGRDVYRTASRAFSHPSWVPVYSEEEPTLQGAARRTARRLLRSVMRRNRR